MCIGGRLQERSRLGFEHYSFFPAPTMAAGPIFEVPDPAARMQTSNIGSMAKAGAETAGDRPNPSLDRLCASQSQFGGTSGLAWTTSIIGPRQGWEEPLRQFADADCWTGAADWKPRRVAIAIESEVRSDRIEPGPRCSRVGTLSRGCALSGALRGPCILVRPEAFELTGATGAAIVLCSVSRPHDGPKRSNRETARTDSSDRRSATGIIDVEVNKAKRDLERMETRMRGRGGHLPGVVGCPQQEAPPRVPAAAAHAPGGVPFAESRRTAAQRKLAGCEAEFEALLRAAALLACATPRALSRDPLSGPDRFRKRGVCPKKSKHSQQEEQEDGTAHLHDSIRNT